MMTDNNKKDKRFSKLLSTIEKGKVLPDKEFLAQLRDKSVEEFETCSGESKDHSQAKTISIWRIIMNSKITKFAAAAVILIAILIGINQFRGSVDGSSVAFGQVLEYLQTYSYTFDLTIETGGEETGQSVSTTKAMVWELGKIRMDSLVDGGGGVSSITDLNAGRSLILLHKNKVGMPFHLSTMRTEPYQTGVTKKETVLNKNTEAIGIFSFYVRSIENLWNLRDGEEEYLGEKEIDGQDVTGFRASQEDQYFEYEITIWVDAASGVPSLVEVVAMQPEESHPVIIWTMENFDLDVDLDEKLFSLDVPEGYTLAYQEDLETLEVETEPSDESGKIVQMFELWSLGKKDEAIGLLLEVEWTEQIEFGKEPYLFSMTEKGYVSLKAKDQKSVMEEMLAMVNTIKKVVEETIAVGQSAVANQDYEEAERYLEATFQLGELLVRNQEGMLIARMVGISVKKKTLNEMINLYTTTNDLEKLQEAEKQLRAAETELDKIKKQAADHR